MARSPPLRCPTIRRRAVLFEERSIAHVGPNPLGVHARSAVSGAAIGRARCRTDERIPPYMHLTLANDSSAVLLRRTTKLNPR